jgi:Flp pilus assembly protein TadD
VRACVLALLVCLAGGCAAHQSPDTTGIFVHRSQATYSDGATFDVPKVGSDSGGVRTQVQPVDPSISKAPQAKTSDSPTLEATNNGLGTALARLKLRPTAEAYVAVGEAYHRLGVLDQAESNFSLALRMNSHSAAASEGLARVWRDWGLPQRGLPYAYRAISFGPRLASAENTLGTVLFALGDLADAKAHFQKAAALDPAAPYPMNNLCYVAFMLGDEGPAADRCTEALALSPDVATTRNNLALVYAAGGHTSQAADEFQRASNGPAASFNMGIVHMARREYREAVSPFEVACHAKPEVPGGCAWAAQARRLAASSLVDIRK